MDDDDNRPSWQELDQRLMERTAPALYSALRGLVNSATSTLDMIERKRSAGDFDHWQSFAMSDFATEIEHARETLTRLIDGTEPNGIAKDLGSDGARPRRRRASAEGEGRDMTDATFWGQPRTVRSVAIAVVDRLQGCTIEFASDPERHRRMYNAAESAILRELDADDLSTRVASFLLVQIVPDAPPAQSDTKGEQP